jgi:sugar phosphate isomerase/epimerase
MEMNKSQTPASDPSSRPSPLWKWSGGIPGLHALGLLFFAAALHAASIPPECKVGGFVIGCQSYTFRQFTVLEQIEKTAQAGGKIIELHPKDKLSPEQPELKFDHNASEASIQKVKDQLAKYHVRAVNYGVVYSQGSEVNWRKVFEFSRKLGLYAITTEATADLDLLEKLAREFDIKVAIHNHAKRPDDSGYLNWDPQYVLSLVKARDPRVGVCADTGHWAASGLQPLDCIKLLHGRIVSVHLKDREEVGKAGPDLVFGTGVLKVKEVLDELKRQEFAGNISLEYEARKGADTMKEVAQCIDFVRHYSEKTP